MTPARDASTPSLVAPSLKLRPGATLAASSEARERLNAA
jgi:hypothetical protein